MELLYKRVSQGFIIARPRQDVCYAIDQAMEQCMPGELVVEDQFIRFADAPVVLARRSKPGEPDRKIEHISIAEIAAAAERILAGAYGMNRTVLCSEVARVFGFERTGVKIKQRANEAIDYLVHTGKVTDHDGKIQLLEV
jgi:hypothetical protein